MAERTAVDRLYQEAEAITELLAQSGEYSLKSTVEDSFRKALLLAAASYFEHTLSNCVLRFIQQQSQGSRLVPAFAQTKGINRQYHTWFQWEATNANQFFGLFGSEFRAFMRQKVAASNELKDSIRAFLELGNERNRLVHQDYATFAMDKTIKEVYERYSVARHFVELMPQALSDCEDEIKQSHHLARQDDAPA